VEGKGAAAVKVCNSCLLLLQLASYSYPVLPLQLARYYKIAAVVATCCRAFCPGGAGSGAATQLAVKLASSA
jgi:hypothetical protein